MSKQRHEICCDEAGLVVVPSGSGQSAARSSLTWDKVTTVLGYKRDCYSVDLICLGFITAEGTIEVNEQMPGWSELVERLPAVLPGTLTLSDWWERVAKPPFAPSVTTLYRRP